jgi:hypothetical protein
LSTSDCNNSVINDCSLISKNKNQNGILLFSPNLNINNLYIENVVVGLYKGGVNTTIDNFTYKNIDEPIRNNTFDFNLNISNVKELFDNSNSNTHDTSGFLAHSYVVFDSTQAVGTILLLRSKNIDSIIKTGTGLFTVNFKYQLKNLPVVSACARYYGGSKVVFISNYPTLTSVNMRLEDFSGNLSDSDYVSLLFY